MILSGPNACLGSTKEARILPVFLHSPREEEKSRLDYAQLRLQHGGRDAGDLLLIEEGSGLLISGMAGEFGLSSTEFPVWQERDR